MNAERLHTIVIALRAEMDKSNITNALQELNANLQRTVNQPHPQHQQALSQSLKNIVTVTADAPSDSFSPTWREIVKEIGGEDLLGTPLKVQIDAILARNQITPAVALEELQALHTKLQAFKTALDHGASALGHFNIGDETLNPGECEIGVLIPRAAVENHLLEFADELKEIGFILNTFSEVVTGKKDDLSIRTISSSELLVHLQASAPYAACVAVCVERVVALYKQLLEIRKLNSEIKKQGVPDKEVSGIENYANELMEKGIDKIAIEVVKEFHKKDDRGRKNELTTAVRISLNMIANRIDHGFNLEVRVAPMEKEDGEDATDKDPATEELQRAVIAIQSATPNMQYMKLEGKPLLRLTEAPKKPKKDD